MDAFAGLMSYSMDYPHEVSIETQAVCNAACTFCPYPIIERKGTKMPDALLDRLIDEMISWDRSVYLSPFKLSDPLLDRRLIPLIEKVNSRSSKIWTRIFTNGSALTPDKIAGLSKLKRITHLWVSLNSHIPEEYEKLMGLKFDNVAKKLDYLHSVEFPHPVMLSTVGYPNEDFRKYCFDRWPNFESMAIRKDGWLGFTDPQRHEIPDKPCSRWFELSIMATGKVATCCFHSGEEEKYNIGDVNTRSMYEIYNDPSWKDRRKNLVSRKTLDLATSPCASCSY